MTHTHTILSTAIKVLNTKASAVKIFHKRDVCEGRAPAYKTITSTTGSPPQLTFCEKKKIFKKRKNIFSFSINGRKSLFERFLSRLVGRGFISGPVDTIARVCALVFSRCFYGRRVRPKVGQNTNVSALFYESAAFRDNNKYKLFFSLFFFDRYKCSRRTISSSSRARSRENREMAYERATRHPPQLTVFFVHFDF